jgi:hypothetical protein
LNLSDSILCHLNLPTLKKQQLLYLQATACKYSNKS